MASLPRPPSASIGHLRDSRSCGANYDDEDLLEIAHASDRRRKGVTQDLSELTKTFSRQVWGVASFLSAAPHTLHNRADRQQICAATTVSDVLPCSRSEMDPGSHSGLPACSLERGEELLSNELLERHSKGGNPQGSRNAMLDLSKLHLRSDRRIIGVGKDLAELRGTVATSLSRIVKVMRDETDRNRRADVAGSDLGDEFYPRAADERERTVNIPQRPGVDTFLEPLFNNLLQGTSLNRESSRGMTDGDLTRLGSCEEGSDRGKNIQHGVGITDEVLAFARNISMHPETWLDFPLLSDDEDDDEYEMSDVQKEHVFQVELASPRLAALRIELCPDYMSAGCFWKIYFVLLHPRLTKKDAVLLSTPLIVEARALLLKKLQTRDVHVSRSASLENDSLNSRNKLQEGDAVDMSKSLPEKLSGVESFKIVSLQAATEISQKDFHQIEDLPGAGDDRLKISSQSVDYGEEIQNKNILASTVKLAVLRYEEEEADADKWLEEEISPYVGSGAYWGNDEDVSFSDLEEDDDSMASKFVESSISKRSCEWVQLNENQASQELEGLELSKMNQPEGLLHINTGRKDLFQDSESQFWDQASKKPEIGMSNNLLASADFQ